jgi:hypothetical protein
MTQQIDITLDELRRLHHRIMHHELEAGDWAICGALVSKLITRAELQHLRMLAKLKAAEEAKAQGPGNGDDASSDSTEGSNANAPDKSDSDESSSNVSTEAEEKADGPDHIQKPGSNKKNKGHGRNGASSYTNAKDMFHTLTEGVIGEVCEACQGGPIFDYREKIIVRIVGQPLFCAERHHYEQGRCRICGNIIRSTGPESVFEGIGTSYIIYDYSACAILITMHYFGGAPFKRLELLHKGWGVPMPDANQWYIVEKSDDLLFPLYKALERFGIHNAVNLRIDDTGSMVIEIRRQIQKEIAELESLGKSTKDVRTGINATGVYLETPQGTIILYYTGRHHAGEMLDQLLTHRQNSQVKLVKVSDGASKNFDHQQADKLIECTCNAHAFLKFVGIKDKYPEEYAIAGEIYKTVFDNDDKAKALGLSPEERMLYHREHSKPLMEKLKTMCENKIKNKEVEPRSLLWEPLSFIINQWPRLTKFYEEPNVPLDTNILEQKLIIIVRYLAGSFNYQTENGAEVGDHLMSLIATAQANDIEPVAYLTHCLRNHEDLAQRPEDYLPWVYRDRLAEREKLPNPEAPVGCGPGAACPADPGAEVNNVAKRSTS